MSDSVIAHRPKTAEFIQAVKDYRIQTGEGLREAVEYISQQIENGTLHISKYRDGLGDYSHPHFTADKLQALYLSWVNNYLSIVKFAEDNALTSQQAECVIDAGRTVNEAIAKFKKAMKEIS